MALPAIDPYDFHDPVKAPPPQVLVGVRYVGPLPVKKDSLLNVRGRQWQRGEAIQVPLSEAKSYLKHPGIWRLESDPWGGVIDTITPSPEALLNLVRSRDATTLVRYDTELARLVILATAAEQEPQALAASPAAAFSTAPLDPEDAQRLEVFIPGLARAIVQGTDQAVQSKLGMVRNLLLASPALLVACVETEGNQKNRGTVLRRLAAITAQQQGLALPTGTGDEPEPPDDDEPDSFDGPGVTS